MARPSHSARSKTMDDAHEFQPLLSEIEDRPINPLGHTMFWAVILLVLGIVAWATLSQVDVVVSADGQILPDGYVKLLQPLETGVLKKIYVREGQIVRKGQPLMDIDPALTMQELAGLQTQLRMAQLTVARLEGRATGEGDALAAAQTRLGTAQTASLSEALAARRHARAALEAQQAAKAARIRQLEELIRLKQDQDQHLQPVQDLVPRQQVQDVLLALASYQGERNQLFKEQAELGQQIQQLGREMGAIAAQHNVNQAKDLTQAQRDMAMLEARLQQTQFRREVQQIMSPVDGVVQEVFLHTEGGVVTPAQKLVSIVPNEVPLFIKSSVLNKDIGHVKTGLPVSIKVDTYEYQRYGTIDGIVRQIAPTSRADEKRGLVYDVLVTPKQRSLRVDGDARPLLPGMTVRADIKVGKRRIIEFWLYPVLRYLNEGFSVR